MGVFSRLFKKTSQKQINVGKKPLSPRENLLCKAFPKELYDDVKAVCKLLYRNATYGSIAEVSEVYVELNLNNISVQIPYRIYFYELSSTKINALTETQKTVLYCIFTRSCNGYLREKYIRLLLKTEYPRWAIPFIVSLCDDYVLEIISAIYELLKDKDTTDIKQFCQENKKAVRVNYDRMLNYWYEYDKWAYLDFYEYVGRKLYRECLGYSRKLRKHKLYIKAYGPKSD